MILKVTPSLINSYRYWANFDKGVYDDPEVGEAKEAAALQDFKDYLCRVERPTSEAAQAGIDFENKLTTYDFSDVEDETLRNIYIDMAHKVKGGLWQVKLTKVLDVKGLTISLEGKTDVIKQSKIFDVKRTSKYDIGKFQGNIQHASYILMSEINDFEYLINENDKNFYVESYTLTQGQAYNEVVSGIIELIDGIKNLDMWDEFVKNWSKQ